MDSLKQNRTASFVIVTLIYIVVVAVGIAAYNMLTFDWWLNLLIADVIATALTFAFSMAFGNASVYDPYWSVQPIVILVAFAIGKELTAVRALLLAAVILWGVRLTGNWAYTFKSLTHQDWRYTMLKEKTGVFYPLVNFTGIHMVPTLIVYACTLPAVYVFLHDGAWNAGSIMFFGLSVGAATMQGAADYQLHRFRKHRTGVFIREKRFVKVVFTKAHKKLQCESYDASILLFAQFLIFVPMCFSSRHWGTTSLSPQYSSIDVILPSTIRIKEVAWKESSFVLAEYMSSNHDMGICGNDPLYLTIPFAGIFTVRPNEFPIR